MRGGSLAAETDHVWAAAAHISPLCKVAGPPMINSTGEPADKDRERSPALTTEGNRGVLSQPGAGAVLRDRKSVTPIIRNICRSSGRMPARDSS